MTTRDAIPSSPSPHAAKELSAELRRDEEHQHPAAGLPAVVNVMRYAHETSGLVRGTRALLRLNQVEGFDCPSCAWPDPHASHRALAEFCENGARAAVHEADRRRVDAAFFAAHSIAELRTQSDYWLEQQGRLVEPMVARGGTHYEPISWKEAYALAGRELRKLTPDECVFYTSGRASNEAAFVYQLFARVLGTNNLPDCSNMCHESSGVGLGESIGVGKGTVQLDDFALADAIFLVGQNPGTNHPRMLSTLAEARQRGAAIVGVNPIRERGLLAFAHPQTVAGMVGLGDKICTHVAQVRIGGDVALFKGMMKELLALDAERGGGVLDRAFLAEHTVGFAELEADLHAEPWDDIVAESGLSREAIRALAELYAAAPRVIVCWAMGITQHKNGVDNVKAIVDLLLLRGNLGRPGAGVCPVRGHSNVQGDRTMGIYERPTEAFLAGLEAATGIVAPREHGVDAVAAVHAFESGRARAFMGLGGNFARAMSDSDRSGLALRRAALTVHVATKLNRTHLDVGAISLLLPCLGRSEIDLREGKPQLVSVEDSMSVVHRSQGRLPPADPGLESEVAIVCGIAAATVGKEPVDFAWLAGDYDRIRDLIAKAIPGFEDFNARLRTPEGFVLENGAAQRRFRTRSGKAELSVVPLVRRRLEPGQLVLMTIRSHDQFNTTIYALNDRYRDIHRRRDVLLMNAEDIAERGLAAEDAVTITSHFAGETRSLAGFRVYPFDLPRGSCAAYYPETNPLVPLDSFADGSRTPTSKSVVVSIARS